MRTGARDLCRLLGIATNGLPVIWDADLLLGPRTAAGEDTYVLCEINVSSVFPIPDEAPETLAAAMRDRLAVRRCPQVADHAPEHQA